jgi:hypothetical protein
LQSLMMRVIHVGDTLVPVQTPSPCDWRRRVSTSWKSKRAALHFGFTRRSQAHNHRARGMES